MTDNVMQFFWVVCQCVTMCKLRARGEARIMQSHRCCCTLQLCAGACSACSKLRACNSVMLPCSVPAPPHPAAVAALVRGPKGKLTKTCRCKAGYGSTSGSTCRICPVGSYAEGGTMDDCRPCPFGYTSRAGAESPHECVPESQPCPIGQIAPPGAVSAEVCACIPGYGGGFSGCIGARTTTSSA